MINFMFYVPIYQATVSDWNRKKKILLSFIDEDKMIKPEDNSRNEHITTDYFNDKNSKINSIEMTIKDDLNAFSDVLTLKTSINNYWFERADTGEYHPIHNHGIGRYSAVLYLEYDKDVHTPVEFVSPFLNFMNGTQALYKPDNVNEGSLLIFPSAINHFTHPNKSNKPRTVLAFNLDIYE